MEIREEAVPGYECVIQGSDTTYRAADRLAEERLAQGAALSPPALRS